MKIFYILVSVSLWLTFILSPFESDVSIRICDIPANVSFSEDVMPVFNANCKAASSHATGAIPSGLPPQKSYNHQLFRGQMDTTNAENSFSYLAAIFFILNRQLS